MMLLNEPKNVTENTGQVMIHTFQPGPILIYVERDLGDVLKVTLEFVCILVHNFCAYFLLMKTLILFVMNEYFYLSNQ